MNYQNLGKTGLKVSKLGIGTMNFGKRLDQETAFAILDKAYDLGINILDTADSYWGAETVIGKWLKQSGVRNEFIINSKVGMPVSKKINDQGISNLHIQKQLKKSLDVLDTSYIDIYQVHSYMPTRDILGLIRLFSQLKDEGVIHILGGPMFCRVIDLQKWEFLARQHGLNTIETKLIVISLLSRSMHKSELVDLSKELNFGLIGFGAIGGGLLTGKYTSDEGFPENGREMFKDRVDLTKVSNVMNVVNEIADELGVSSHQVSLSWVLKHDFLDTVMVGASAPEHLDSYVDALELELSEDMMRRLNKISDKYFIW